MLPGEARAGFRLCRLSGPRPCGGARTCSGARSGLALGQRRGPGAGPMTAPVKLHRGPKVSRTATRTWSRPRLQCDPGHTSERALASNTVGDASRLVHVACGARGEIARCRVVAMARGVRRRCLRFNLSRDPRRPCWQGKRRRGECSFLVFPSCSLGVVFAPQQPPRIVRRDGRLRR